MKKYCFLFLMLLPNTAGADSLSDWANSLSAKPAPAQNEFDTRLNRAVQIEQLEHFEREHVREDFEPFRGMFKHSNDTPMGRAIEQAGEDMAVKQRTQQRLADPYYGR